ncbi:hypothetical protein HYE36_04695 [Mycoplasmopsis bovis]|nr:hypothetical protein HYE36_04695 [Mycoplasmopsis bovis]
MAFAASNGANLIYKCINFKSSGNKLSLAATDTFRLGLLFNQNWSNFRWFWF